MHIREHEPLASLTTFQTGGQAEFFVEVENEQELIEVLDWNTKKQYPVFVLGGGSNILISDTGFPGLVIKNNIQARNEIAETEYEFGAGENWDDVVHFAVMNDLQGIEMLSYIPGTLGGAIVQNIGAYGGEIADVVVTVTAINIHTQEKRIFPKAECLFSYRYSFFKTIEGRNWIVTSATLRFSKSNSGKITFKEVEEKLGGKKEALIQDIRNTVIAIRMAKLPDWKHIGTAGSFFKNPFIESGIYETLTGTYPEIPGFPVDGGRMKVPLGWILDKVCGLKGYTEGSVGLYEKQALVIVNHGGARTEDVAKLADFVSKKVHEKTGITIEPEVEYIGEIQAKIS
ncbi:MAG TPA: UDP-N-acetylmuramate dehydrogenase [Candidatus Paceibacterota bacterium]|nr:UDP-N-acetylmuramate dehydrogenase [Candidatus Paceibacterota bacterium]